MVGWLVGRGTPTLDYFGGGVRYPARTQTDEKMKQMEDERW